MQNSVLWAGKCNMAGHSKSSANKTKSRKNRIIVHARHALASIVVRTPKNPHRAFRLTRPRLYMTGADVRAAWRLQLEMWSFVWQWKRILLGLGALYAVLGYVLVGGISQFDYVAFKEATEEVMDGDVGAFGTAFTLFGTALTGGLNPIPTDAQQFLSATLLIFFWLSLVWAARMLAAGKEIRLRDALYNSGAPIVPTLVMLAVIAVQLIPAALGIFGYATALNGGWLDGGVESMSFAIAALLLCLLSAYFVVSSITGLVIATLPGTYPWQALKTARELVINRRWSIVFRVLMVAVHVVLLWGVVLIPIFLLDNWLRFDWLPLVPIFAQAMMGLTLVLTSVYVYKLYRSLL